MVESQCSIFDRSVKPLSFRVRANLIIVFLHIRLNCLIQIVQVFVHEEQMNGYLEDLEIWANTHSVSLFKFTDVSIVTNLHITSFGFSFISVNSVPSVFNCAAPSILLLPSSSWWSFPINFRYSLLIVDYLRYLNFDDFFYVVVGMITAAWMLNVDLRRGRLHLAYLGTNSVWVTVVCA